MIDTMRESERQLPPSDRSEQPDAPVQRSRPPSDKRGLPPPSPQPPPPRMAVVDIELHSEIKARLGPDFSQADLAREIGVSPSAVNKWVNNKPEGDVLKLEFSLRFWLESIDERIDLRRDIKPTGITSRMAYILKSISRTNDFGIITGRAGIGKTCGLQLFRLVDPMAVLLTADAQHGDARCMIEDLWFASKGRRRKGDPYKRNDVLVSRFKGSNRLLMIDNCHALTAGGLKWAFAFHNRTGCPVALIGNPMVEQKIHNLPDEDQYTTRVGQFRAVMVAGIKDATELAELLLDQYAPAIKRDLLDQAVTVCQTRGFARRLKKQARLALEILQGGISDSAVIKTMRGKGMTDPQIAFALAATQLSAIEDADARQEAA